MKVTLELTLNQIQVLLNLLDDADEDYGYLGILGHEGLGELLDYLTSRRDWLAQAGDRG